MMDWETWRSRSKVWSLEDERDTVGVGGPEGLSQR